MRDCAIMLFLKNLRKIFCKISLVDASGCAEVQHGGGTKESVTQGYLAFEILLVL